MSIVSSFGPYRIARSGAIVVAASMPSLVAASTRPWMFSTCWLLLEVLMAVSIAYLLGVVAAIPSPVGWDRWLDRSISRGLELVAALPLVLTAAVVVLITSTPIPIAMALVIGTLGGLRCARVILGSNGRERGSNDTSQRVSGQRRAMARRVSMASLPALFEQLIGLEAAFTWLGLHDDHWAGGWGACLGRSARQEDLSQLAVWSLATVGLSVGLKLLAGQRPGSQHDDALQNRPQSVPPKL